MMNTELVASGGTSRADISGKYAWVYVVAVKVKECPLLWPMPMPLMVQLERGSD